MKKTADIKVLVVGSSSVYGQSLVEGLAKDLSIESVWTAEDTVGAEEKINNRRPDVMILDIDTSKSHGIEFLKDIMLKYPMPVVVISSDQAAVHCVLKSGGVDFIAKPKSFSGRVRNSFIGEVLIKTKIASMAKIENFEARRDLTIKDGIRDIGSQVIAIGASTGGTEAIYSIVKALPEKMPGILIVLHMPPVFTRLYAERLNGSCVLDVKEAMHGDAVRPGKVLVAPGNYHMRLMRESERMYVSCRTGEKVSGHCPSVDVLFDSVAEAAKDKAVGVILTGMGKDGASGLLNMRKQGAYTIGQDSESSIVYGMPMAAYNIGAVMRQLPLEKIAEEICSRFLRKP